MAKEILLYSPIYSFTAEWFITKVQEVEGEDITVRVNSPGGGVFAGWGMIAKLREQEKPVKIKVDGIAASMAAIFAVFFEDVECLDVSRFMIHRADADVYSDDERALLASINKQVKEKMKARIDSDKLKELKGYTVDEIFDSQDQIDVWLSAKEAKAIGLVKRVKTLKPQTQEATAYGSFFERVAAVTGTDEALVAAANDPKKSNKSNTTVMTIEKLKAEHPEVYAAAMKAGADKERDRVGAWMAYVDVDPEAVAKGIKEGAELSATASAELARKSFSAKALGDLKADSGKTVETEEADGKPAATAQEKEVADFQANVRKGLGLK